MVKKRRATKKLKSVTKDGKKINLAANLSLPEGIQKMKEYGVPNIGLYRTEFLFMDREDIPGEEEQFRHYKKLGDSFKGDYLVIRTLDAGGDKNVNTLNNIKDENNPFLGWRGIRICLDRKDIFKDQLKAILRAAAFSNIMLMYPMVNSPEQYESIMEIFNECVYELKKSKTVFREDLKKGILLEVPSAAYYMDYFCQKLDFFSIGTNDMLQFLLAVDRTNDKISNMYSWYNKALFTIMDKIVTDASKYKKPVQVCGEIASDPLCLPVLIGLGIQSLSMVPSAIPKIKLLLRSFSVDECKEITKTVLNMDRDTEIKSFLSGRFKEFMGREEVINEMSEMWEGK
jgi:phosphotransferase system enzyme I (PtsI)